MSQGTYIAQFDSNEQYGIQQLLCVPIGSTDAKNLSSAHREWSIFDHNCGMAWYGMAWHDVICLKNWHPLCTHVVNKYVYYVFLTVTMLNKYNLLELEAALTDGNVADQWRQLGIELQLEPILDVIASVCDNDTSACLSFMLLRWLISKNATPTLEKIATALSSSKVGKLEVAKFLLESKDKYNWRLWLYDCTGEKLKSC